LFYSTDVFAPALLYFDTLKNERIEEYWTILQDPVTGILGVREAIGDPYIDSIDNVKLYFKYKQYCDDINKSLFRTTGGGILFDTSISLKMNTWCWLRL
jgi:hypothetical protein